MSSLLLLQDLPAEILNHIFTHLLPSNCTFLLNTRGSDTPANESTSDAQTSPRLRGTPLLQENEPTPEYPAIIFSNSGIDIFTILLLHSKIYPRVIECLYSNNTFYPPDLTTLSMLRVTWSSLAISSVRTIRIDACGAATRITRGYNHWYSWTELADLDVACIPTLFHNIRELRLGGVGPGIVYRRRFTYRGSASVRDTEVNDAWTLDNLLLIAKVVGIGVTDGLDVVDGMGGGLVSRDRHALSDGRVFCMRHDQSESSPTLPRGSHRLHGTRIVRRSEVVREGPLEEEVVDVKAALEKARKVHEEFVASGYIEVPPVRKPVLREA